MDGIVAHDARVWAILKTPDEYFAKARREAWLRAKQDVADDLARRAQRRMDLEFLQHRGLEGEEPSRWSTDSRSDS